MKKFLLSVVLATTLALTSCQFDDSGIWDKFGEMEESIRDHEERITALEELCKQMNTNIEALQTLVNALEKRDYVTNVSEVRSNGEVIGYTISFAYSDTITIYHGKDGQDGQDGANGADGKDGYTPQIGVMKDTDNIYYWTLDGEWLLDAKGNKIKAVGTDGADGKDGQDGANGTDGKDGQNGTNGSDGKDGQDGTNGTDGKDGADGKDGITPQLKIENDYWYVSYDNGATWVQLGKATGEDGKDGQDGTNGSDGTDGQDGTDGKDGVDGDSFFQNVNTANAEYVIFTLADGTQIKLPTWYSFEQLRTQCNQMNTNITSLQTIVQALQTVDYLVSCVPLMENGVQIGYTLTFAKTGSIVIYHGKNGKDGVDGEDGKDGTNGVDATVPVISAKTHTDNVLYWTINGEWLLDDQGNKIPVHGRDGVDGTDGTNGSNGEDGVTPQLKIEDGYWYVSYNNGVSWTKLGKATGENGKDGEDGIDGSNGTNGADGDAFFQSVTQDEDFIHLILSTGEQIDIPRHHPLSVTFTETEDIRVLANKTYSIGYTITGADDKTNIKALAQDGFRAVVKKTDNATGTIEITTPATILPTEILVFVTDGKERTIMRSINFVEGVIVVSTKSYTVDYVGGTVQVPLSTNIDYTVEIPEADKSWISVADTRVVMREETLAFIVAANSALSARYTTIKLVDALGVVSETILITQKAGTSQTIHVASAGTLEELIGTDKDKIEELTLTGKLNTFDFDFIKTMSNLKLLDISSTTNTTLPASCLANSTITTVLLPLGLTAIPNRAFYQSAITSIYIPETVQTIGEYAFYQCKSITGNLVIPDATTSIGNYCFQECTFDGTLTIGNNVKTIGKNTFYQCTNFIGNLIIPNSVTELGENVFYKCSGFNGCLTIGDNVQSIPNWAFHSCTGITGALTLGENIQTIGNSAFRYCSFTGNLIIPDKCTTIGGYAFCDCVKFTGYLLLGSSLVEIGSRAFVKAESSLEYLDDVGYTDAWKDLNYTKTYCKSLTPPSLSVYKQLVYESNYGYSKHYNIEYPLSAGSTDILYIHTGCKSSYQADENWSAIFTIIEETEF